MFEATAWTTADQPSALPPPPRSVRTKAAGARYIWFGRLVVLPHIIIGIIFLSIILVRIAVQEWGTPVQLIVDSKRAVKVNSFEIECHYVLDGQRFEESSSLSQSTYNQMQVGDTIEGRAAQFHGYALCLTDVERPNQTTREFLLIALMWTLAVGYFSYQILVVPRRQRRIAKMGCAVAGQVSGRRVEGGRSRTHHISYQFIALDGTIRSGTHEVLSDAYDAAFVGAPVTVIYDPKHPRRSIAYEYSNFIIEPAMG